MNHDNWVERSSYENQQISEKSSIWEQIEKIIIDKYETWDGSLKFGTQKEKRIETIL
jgi:hypothetical protein